MRIKAKKQPIETPVEELEEGPVKPSCGFFRLWKRLFWKHRPRVHPAETSPVVENLLARRLSKESVKRPTDVGKSGEGDYLVTTGRKPSSAKRFKIIDRGNATVEEEVDLMLDRPSSPDLYLSGRGINTSVNNIDKVGLMKPDSELSLNEISQMLDIGNQLSDLLSDVKGLSRQMDNVIQRKQRTVQRDAPPPMFKNDGPAKDCPFVGGDDSSVDLSDHDKDDRDKDSESDTISWASTISPEPRRYYNKTTCTGNRSGVMRAWEI